MGKRDQAVVEGAAKRGTPAGPLFGFDPMSLKTMDVFSIRKLPS